MIDYEIKSKTGFLRDRLQSVCNLLLIAPFPDLCLLVPSFKSRDNINETGNGSYFSSIYT